MTKKLKITFLDSSTMDPGDLDLSALNEFGDCTFHKTTCEEETLLANGNMDIWKTAVFYHLIHASVLLVITFSLKNFNKLSWFCFVAGIVFFSGSLYLLSLYQLSYLGPVTPLGGALLIGGWLSLWRS